MVNVKKKKYYLRYFVILLTLTMLLACSSKKYKNYQTTISLLNINDSISTDNKIENSVLESIKKIPLVIQAKYIQFKDKENE